QYSRFFRRNAIVLALQEICQPLVGAQRLATALRLSKCGDEQLHSRFVQKIIGKQMIEHVNRARNSSVSYVQFRQLQQERNPAALQPSTARNDSPGVPFFRQVLTGIESRSLL